MVKSELAWLIIQMFVQMSLSWSVQPYLEGRTILKMHRMAVLIFGLSLMTSASASASAQASKQAKRLSTFSVSKPQIRWKFDAGG